MIFRRLFPWPSSWYIFLANPLAVGMNNSISESGVNNLNCKLGRFTSRTNAIIHSKSDSVCGFRFFSLQNSALFQSPKFCGKCVNRDDKVLQQKRVNQQKCHIDTKFLWFLWFTHFCCEILLSRFMHFFSRTLETEKAESADWVAFRMYVLIIT